MNKWNALNATSRERTMKIESAYVDWAMFVVFMIAVVLTIVYMLQYAGVINVMPSFLR